MMKLERRLMLEAQQSARRDLAQFRHWSGRVRCAVCGGALARDEQRLRVHGVPVHAGCAGFNTSGYGT